MYSVDHGRTRLKQTYAWIGAVCLLIIVPVKALRFLSDDLAMTTLVGVAPSLLGPAGALFFVLASIRKDSRLSLLRAALLVGSVSIALEFLQILPRPGILGAIHYTFDPLDIVSSLLSVAVAYLIARWMSSQPTDSGVSRHL